MKVFQILSHLQLLQREKMVKEPNLMKGQEGKLLFLYLQREQVKEIYPSSILGDLFQRGPPALRHVFDKAKFRG